MKDGPRCRSAPEHRTGWVPLACSQKSPPAIPAALKAGSGPPGFRHDEESNAEHVRAVIDPVDQHDRPVVVNAVHDSVAAPAG